MSRLLRHGYDRSADGYDERFQALQRPKYEAMLGAASGELASRLARGRVLDLGCGTGLALAFARERGLVAADRRWTGLDLSRRMLAHARRAGLDAVQGDAARLPFATAAFDLVLAFTLLGVLPEATEPIVRELARVLAPDGTALVTVLARGHDARIETLLAEAGLRPGPARPCGQDVGFSLVLARGAG
jgi:SAM-dependent methyltransferase